VEVDPFLPLHAGTQTISQTPQQRASMFQKSTSTPILPTSTIKMEGSGDVLQDHHTRGRAISHDAVIILASQQRNWYLYHNITTKLLWKKHNISTKMIPFGAHSPFLINHHNFLIGKGGQLCILC
jgi:hypothetical protein